MLSNLDTYFKHLEAGINPLQVKLGFIHDEPEGVKALDQKGAETKKPKQTRLYVYPEVARDLLHVLIIGEKTGQNEDITFCKRYAKGLKEGKKDGK